MKIPNRAGGQPTRFLLFLAQEHLGHECSLGHVAKQGPPWPRPEIGVPPSKKANFSAISAIFEQNASPRIAYKSVNLS
jgi:hypothetical protein